MKDYYDVLGIPRDAAPGVVKVAYEGRMKKAARLKDAERAAEERELKEAYAILSNPAKREDFDASLMEVDAKLTGSGSNAPLVIGVAVVMLAVLGAGYFLMERSKAQRATQIEQQRAAERQKAASPQDAEKRDAARQREEEARAAMKDEAKRNRERSKAMTPEERAAARAASKKETLEEAEGRPKP